MKQPLCASIFSVSLAFAVVGFSQQSSPSGTTASGSGAATPTAGKSADPFTRDGQPASPTDAAAKKAERPFNVYGLVEYIEVPRDRWLEYSGAHVVNSDASALRTEVQRWITAGQAKPIELTCVPTKSGVRMMVESIIEWRYPTEYVSATPTPVPSSFDSRNAGFTFEWETRLMPDGQTLQSFLQPQIVRFCGNSFPTFAERKTAQPRDVGQPLFVTSKPTLSISSKSGRPVLLQVSTPPDESGRLRDEVRLLAFFRGMPVPLNAAKPGAPGLIVQDTTDGRPPLMTKKEFDALRAGALTHPQSKARYDEIRQLLSDRKAFVDYGLLTMEIERLEVSLADLNAWFEGKDLVAGTHDLREAALAWIGAGRGCFVDRQIGPVRSGERHVWESSCEVRYPTEYKVEGESVVAGKDKEGEDTSATVIQKPTSVIKNPVVSPLSFDTRNTGYTVEIEPTVTEDGEAVDVNIQPGHVRFFGTQVVHRREIDGRMEADMEQPLFCTMKITTNVALSLGVPSLLGITTPADEQAQVQMDSEKRVLTFLTIRN